MIGITAVRGGTGGFQLAVGNSEDGVGKKNNNMHGKLPGISLLK